MIIIRNSEHKTSPLCICPLDGVMDTIGKKWGLLVINEIGNHGRLRFKELMTELKGVAPSTLASILHELDEHKLVHREEFREIPPRVEYSLSSRGRELRDATIPLLRWATRKGNFTVHCACSLIKR